MHRLVPVLACLLGTTGCLNGLLYTRVTVPLDVNLDETPFCTEQAQDSWNTFRFYIQVDWGSAGIADIARRNGMTRACYADLETLSVLGLWQQRWAHVYGERAQSP